MLAEWRHAYANVALTGGNLVFLLIALKFPTPAGINLAAGLVGITSFYAWYVNLRRFRAVADTPTARIASAPQGYVEFVGKGRHPESTRLASPLTGLPCLWYRYIIEKKTANKWRRVDSSISTEIFGLDDGTGIALVDPNGAEVIASKKQVSIKGSYRHTEWTLIEGEKLYAIGEHSTVGGANADLDLRQAVSSLLAEWKQDKAGLLHRFDGDGDANISQAEWELARHAAHKAVAHERQQIQLMTGTHLMKKPAGRLFLIANRTPEEMVSRYRLWAWAHLALLIMMCITTVMMQ
jgi:hypothetical protein